MGTLEMSRNVEVEGVQAMMSGAEEQAASMEEGNTHADGLCSCPGCFSFDF